MELFQPLLDFLNGIVTFLENIIKPFTDLLARIENLFGGGESEA